MCPPLPWELLIPVFRLLPHRIAFQIGVVLAIGYGFPDIRNNVILLEPNASMDAASAKGQVDLLDWWMAYHRKMGSTPSYSYRALYLASKNGHVAVLDWWKCSGLPLKYTEDAMDSASRLGHISVLNWWRDSGLTLEYTQNAMDTASENGHIDVLRWWEASGLDLRHSFWAIDSAKENGREAVLQWWRDSGFTRNYEEQRNFQAMMDNDD